MRSRVNIELFQICYNITMKILQTPISKADLIKESKNFIDEKFDSMINIRPAQGNRSRDVEDPEIQSKIKAVVSKWLR